MKISKTKLNQIIKEELYNVLSEGVDDTPPTIYGPRAGKKLAGTPAGRYDPDKTQEVDMEAFFKREQASAEAVTFREEAARLFGKFFAGYDDDALEVMVHNDPELDEILSKLYGWNLDLYRHDVQPSPTIVKVAQAFEREKKDIIDNETEFLNRVEQELYATGRAGFEKAISDPTRAATKVKKGRSAIPGTKQHAQLQDLFKTIDAKS